MMRYVSARMIKIFNCILFLGCLQFKAAFAENFPEHLRAHGDVIARAKQWAKAKNTKPKLTGVRISNADLDRRVQVWFRAIDLASCRNASRFSMVPRIMLYGQPGTGKSIACQQIIEQSVHIDPSVVVIKIDCSSLSAKDVQYFRDKVLQVSQEGKPVIVLFEDLHMIASINRKNRDSVQSSTIENLISHFMDDCDKKGVLFLSTTNYVQDLSEKLRSRFMLRIKFDYCDEDVCKQIIRYKLLQEKSEPSFVKEGEDFTLGKKETSGNNVVFGAINAQSVDGLEQLLCRINNLVGQLDMRAYDAAKIKDIEQAVEMTRQSCVISFKHNNQSDMVKRLRPIEAYLACVQEYLQGYAVVFKQEPAIQMLAHETAGKNLRFLDAVVKDISVNKPLKNDSGLSHDVVLQKIAVIKKSFTDNSTRWNIHDEKELDDINLRLSIINSMISIEGRNGNSTAVNKIKAEFGYECLKKRSSELFQKKNA